MTQQKFWNLIQESQPADPFDQQQQLKKLRKALDGLDAAEVASFNELFMQQISASYRWDLWGAAYIINGGCSDDGFEYFRRWLVARGEKTYKSAIENPDSLAALNDLDAESEFEEIDYVAGSVYKTKTGQPLPHYQKRSADEPTGTRWDFDDSTECAKRLPALTNKYLS